MSLNTTWILGLPRDPGERKIKKERRIGAKAIYLSGEVRKKKNEVAINMKIVVSADKQTWPISLHRTISMQNFLSIRSTKLYDKE